jgi:hypothetical protein
MEDVMVEKEEVAPLVIGKIANVIDKPDEFIEANHRLWEDLGMGPTLRKAMGVPFTKISKDRYNGLRVSMNDAGKCKKVQDCIDLVWKRAEGRKN